MGDLGSKVLIALAVFTVALSILMAPAGYPAAVHRAWLFDLLPCAVQDAYFGCTLANMLWLACVTCERIKAAGFLISVFAGYGSNFLHFFVATICSWSLRQKPRVDTVAMRASGVIDGAKTVLIEIIDTSVQLHSRLEVMFSSTLAHCVAGFLASAALLLLLLLLAGAMRALRSVVNRFWDIACRVYWRWVLLLSIASVFGYVGYLWTKVV